MATSISQARAVYEAAQHLNSVVGGREATAAAEAARKALAAATKSGKR
jgi:hypothetical protein